MANNNIIRNIEAITGIEKMRKIDWYKCDRAMSQRVVDYMRCVVWKSELNLKFADEAEKIDNGIAALEKLRGSLFEDQIPVMRATFEARLTQLDKERKAQIEKEATFALSDADKALRKAFSKYAKDGSADPVAAIVAWFKATAGIEITEDAPIIREILEATGEKIDLKVIVRTEGMGATGFNAGNALKMTYAKCYEHMAYVGTIKPVQIPELVRAKYAPKAKKGNKRA